jgi:hypothetical protein
MLIADNDFLTSEKVMRLFIRDHSSFAAAQHHHHAVHEHDAILYY